MQLQNSTNNTNNISESRPTNNIIRNTFFSSAKYAHSRPPPQSKLSSRLAALLSIPTRSPFVTDSATQSSPNASYSYSFVPSLNSTSTLASVNSRTSKSGNESSKSATRAFGQSFIDQTVVITGASRGIGLATARAFLGQGAHVVLVGRSFEALELARDNLLEERKKDKPLCENIASEPNQQQNQVAEISKITILAGDVGNIADVDRIGKIITKTTGPVNVLVNCAGIAHDALLVSTDVAATNDVVAANLFGAINMSRALTKQMLRRRAGCIVNVSSVLAFRGVSGASVYSASKAGIIGFTRSLARELGPKGIRVSAIAPGFIETDMTATLSSDQRAQYLSQTPLGRFGSPEDVASAILFLAQAQYITGHTLVVDGGFTA
ncbi:hypothetical protein HK100_003416 [Physocladia obscura]|uniref:Ketoreductase domain-containing protein n=1 Tax=Physocladia obscura TaxID=109957 RepID=A0AAD5SUY9_9FUNG|nr:hypothetical protein HK100_003416 [Physocladia obscura]